MAADGPTCFASGQCLQLERVLDPTRRQIAQALAREGLDACWRQCAWTAVPARAGLAVCDMNSFAPGTPGGGGVGVSLQLYTHAVVRVLPEGSLQDVIHSDRPLVIAHQLAAYRALLALPPGVFFEAHTFRGFEKHSGLGSTSSAALAVLAGINECLGRPVTLETLRLLVGWNFVEEADTQPGMVKFGWETGMTGMGATGGGLFLLSWDLLLLARYPEFARGEAVFVVFPDAKSQAVHTEEDALLAGAALSDVSTAQRKAHTMLLGIAPAAARGDLAEVGRHVWELQTAGSKVAEIRAFPGLWEFMQEAGGALQPKLLAMSSVGPATLLIASRSCEGAVRQLAAAHSCTLGHVTAVDSTGLRSLPPRLVWVVGPPGAGKTTVCQALEAQLGERAKWVPASSLIRAFISADPECDAAQALQRTQASGEVADYRNTTTHLVQDRLFRLQCQAAGEGAQAGVPLPAPLVVLLDGFPRTVRQALAFERLARLGQNAAGGGSMGTVVVLALRCSGQAAAQRMAARGREAVLGGGPDAAARLSRDESAAVVEYAKGQPGQYAVLEVDAELGEGQVVAQALQGLQSLLSV